MVLGGLELNVLVPVSFIQPSLIRYGTQYITDSRLAGYRRHVSTLYVIFALA